MQAYCSFYEVRILSSAGKRTPPAHAIGYYFSPHFTESAQILTNLQKLN